MAFADALKVANSSKGPPCTIAVTMDRMSDADAKAFRSALDDPNIRHTVIARALQAEGFAIKAATVSRHRAGECKCGR